MARAHSHLPLGIQNSFDGVVSLNGTANLVDYKKFSAAIAASFGGSRTDIPNVYRDRSAEFFPERFTMPIAATTGGGDAVVPPESVLRLLKSVRGEKRARPQHSSSRGRPQYESRGYCAGVRICDLTIKQYKSRSRLAVSSRVFFVLMFVCTMSIRL